MQRTPPKIAFALNLLLIITLVGSLLRPLTVPTVLAAPALNQAAPVRFQDRVQRNPTPKSQLSPKPLAASPETLLQPTLVISMGDCIPVLDGTSYHLDHYVDRDTNTHFTLSDEEQANGPSDGKSAKFKHAGYFPWAEQAAAWSLNQILSGTMVITAQRTSSGNVDLVTMRVHPGLEASVLDNGWQNLGTGNSIVYTGRVGSVAHGLKPGILKPAYLELDATQITLYNACIELPRTLPPDQTLASNECPFCNNAGRQHYVGGPINTQSGNYGYQITDFKIATVGQPLRFERSYNSYTAFDNTLVYSRPLGYGWTHNYDLTLTFGPAEVQLKAPRGSRMRFVKKADGSYSPYSGVWADLSDSGSGVSTVYTVTAANQEQFSFNHLGRWISHRDPKGNVSTLSHSEGLTLTRVSGPSGQRYLDFDYDSQGRLSTVSDHSGRSVSYSYDAQDNLIDVNDTQGNDWRYSYGANHLLQAVYDPENKVIERTTYAAIEGEMKAVWQEDGAGSLIVAIDYLADGRRVITEAGRVTIDTYDGVTNLLQKQTDALNREQQAVFDDNFNRSQSRDARNNVTHYQQDQFGSTQAITDALNSVTHFSYDAHRNLTAIKTAKSTIQNQYDAQNNLLQVDTPSGAIHYAYNAAGQVISQTNRNHQTWHYGYNGAGDLTQIEHPNAEIQAMQYDSLGRLTRLTTERSMSTRFEYDDSDNLTRLLVNEQSGPCDPTVCNISTQYHYNKANQLVLTINPQGDQTRREYDAAARLSRVIVNYQDSNHSDAQPAEDIITRYAYDGYGRLLSIFETLNQAEEREIRYSYDALNRISSVILNYAPGSSDPDQNLTTSYRYQDSGPYALVSVTDPSGVVTRNTYDQLNRLMTVVHNYRTDPCATTVCNLTSHYAYDALHNLTNLRDPLGRETHYAYDALNRLTAVIENQQGSGVYSGIPDENISTYYDYDPEGNLIEVSNPQFVMSTLTYDALNRPVNVSNALGHTWSYAYDAAGNLVQVQDPNSQTQSLSYDLLNRLTAIDYPAPTADIAFSYDALNRRTQLDDSSGTTHYSYDALNQPLTIQSPLATLQNEYDARGNRTRLIYPDGQSISYSFDRAERLISLSPSWASGRYDYTYNQQQQLTSLTRPNGLVSTYAYDSANRLIGLSHKTNAWHMTYDYSLDQVGNISRAEETFAALHAYYLPTLFKHGQPALLPPALPLTPTTRSIAYQYDQLDRLLHVNYDGGHFFNYSYDQHGNRLSQNSLTGVTTYSYDQANRLLEVDGLAYSWDDNGNLLNDGLKGYTYNAANQLIKVTQGLSSTQFSYNGDGDRISQSVDGLLTTYTNDPLGLSQLLRAQTAGQDTLYVPGLAQYANNQWHYFVPDRLGSVRQIVDASSQVLLTQSFDPFGNVLEQRGAGLSEFGFTGEQTDSMGLVYLRARYYAPELGRFLTADTIVPDPLRSIGWNRYAYAGDNPIRYTDPSGHCFFAGVDTAACITAVALGLTLSGLLLTANASAPLPPEEVPSMEQGLLGMTMMFGGFGLSLAPELLLSAGSTCSIAQAASNRGISKFKPSDLAALNRFADKAPSVQAARDLKPIGDTWKVWAEMALGSSQTANNLFIYRVGNQIVGAMKVTSGQTTLKITHLEGFGGGAGTRLMQAAVRESIARGYEGRITLNAAAKSVDFYKKMGGKLTHVQSNTYFFSEEAAQAILNMTP